MVQHLCFRPIQGLFEPVEVFKVCEITDNGLGIPYIVILDEAETGLAGIRVFSEIFALMDFHHFDVFVNYDRTSIEFEEEVAQRDDQRAQLRKLLCMSVNEIELSVRAANCLNNANITTVGQLAMKSEQEMLKYRNFGKKSLNEIKDKLTALGLSLGMKFDNELIESINKEVKDKQPNQ